MALLMIFVLKTENSTWSKCEEVKKKQTNEIKENKYYLYIKSDFQLWEKCGTWEFKCGEIN